MAAGCRLGAHGAECKARAALVRVLADKRKLETLPQAQPRRVTGHSAAAGTCCACTQHSGQVRAGHSHRGSRKPPSRRRARKKKQPVMRAVTSCRAALEMARNMLTPMLRAAGAGSDVLRGAWGGGPDMRCLVLGVTPAVLTSARVNTLAVGGMCISHLAPAQAHRPGRWHRAPLSEPADAEGPAWAARVRRQAWLCGARSSGCR